MHSATVNHPSKPLDGNNRESVMILRLGGFPHAFVGGTLWLHSKFHNPIHGSAEKVSQPLFKRFNVVLVEKMVPMIAFTTGFRVVEVAVEKGGGTKRF